MVEITFALTGWEYFEGLLVSSLKRIFPRVGFLAFPVIMLIGLFGVLRISDDPLSLAAYALAACALLFVLLAVVPAVRAVQYARSKDRAQPATWRFGEGRIEIRIGGNGKKTDWKAFARPAETWHLFLLYSAADGRTIYILPKRAFRDKPRQDRFREMAVKALGKMR
ncbi:MAG: YcxB family protein [Anaerolineales bacterium]|nr:YcxB family protein [Anaerolineales bacterium]